MKLLTAVSRVGNESRYRYRIPEHFGNTRIVSPTRSSAMTQIFGLTLALLLLGSGIWANVGGGSLSQNKGAWVSYANR